MILFMYMRLINVFLRLSEDCAVFEAYRSGMLQIWTNGGVFLQLYVGVSGALDMLCGRESGLSDGCGLGVGPQRADVTKLWMPFNSI